ncbi:MAG TPA: hypothetical protein VFR70_08195 [Flavobacterium sp.]|nr:hypothetical protein [Flavobacterium sp.]
MNRKLLLKRFGYFLAIAVIAAVSLYFYLYKGHRDISSEDASFQASAAALATEFEKDLEASNLKYADKTIEAAGKITSIDSSGTQIVLDGKLAATLKDKAAGLKESQAVKLKGRFVGYDDLLGELKMDQCTISEN